MRIALLGSDELTSDLLRAAIEAGHEIVWAGDITSQESIDLRELAPSATISPEWEILLDQNVAEGVICGLGQSSEEVRAERLNRLVAAAVPLLVTHPIVSSVLPYYELDMVRREAGIILHHFNPLATHPYVSKLAALASQGHESIGQVFQISCERLSPEVSKASLFRALARDAELCMAVGGRIRRVNAIGPRLPDESYASLQVQMTGDSRATLRWGVGPRVGGNDQFRLVLTGEYGIAALTVPAGDETMEPWTLAVYSGETLIESESESFDAARGAIDAFEMVVADEDSARREGCSRWQRATEAMEVVDAVELSLQKGRSIEVFQQQLTQQLAFRGTMAAFGCALLTLATLVLVGAALLGGLEGLFNQPKLFGKWPAIMLAVLAFFLLLQTVPMLLAKPDKPTTEPRPHE